MAALGMMGMRRLGGVSRNAAMPLLFGTSASGPPPKKESDEDAATASSGVDEDEEDMVEMWQDGPKGKEWGGPTRGGKKLEPTRFGDWESGKGRCSDF
jgi:hypothetical protein